MTVFVIQVYAVRSFRCTSHDCTVAKPNALTFSVFSGVTCQSSSSSQSSFLSPQFASLHRDPMETLPADANGNPSAEYHSLLVSTIAHFFSISQGV